MMVNNPNAVDVTGSAAYENSEDTNKSESARSELGKDAFFDLLTTQLKNQDPLEPMDNTKFISQMAQFSSLEQMNNMNSNLEQFISSQSVSQGAALIGKTVETIDSNSGETIKGEVSQVGFEEDKMFAYLESGKKVSMDGISKIY
ncbi:MAG: flagellar hook assembly protein FlgD [Bacillota bacterium]